MKLVFACAAAVCVLAGMAGATPLPGSPIAVLGTIDESTVPLPPTLFDVSFRPITLTPATRYWIELTSTTGNVSWGFTEDISGPGVAGEFVYYGGPSHPNGSTLATAPYYMSVGDGVSVLFDDLAGAPAGSDSTRPHAESFSTGSTSFDLSDVKLVLSGFNLSGTTTVSLYTSVENTPEPISVALFGAGLAGLGTLRRRKK